MNRKKTTCIFLFSLTLAACSHRTEFGRKRLLQISRHNPPVDSSVFNLIDTTAMYERIKEFSAQNTDPKYKYVTTYLKFYANGRVGQFPMYNINEAINDSTKLNPRKADIGYYKYDENGLEVKTFFEHPQGGGYIKYRVVGSENDKLLFIYDQRDSSYYKKIAILPKNALIYTPDW